MATRRGATVSIRKNESRPELLGTYRGQVVEVASTGALVVRIDGGREFVSCDFVQSGAGAGPALGPGDQVLVVVPDGGAGRPAVVGKIGPYRGPNRRQVVLEADEELTIRCGDATIAFRKDGRILIKGAEIVSHARGRNRIRGGSIQIN
jgi:hypothetical protein